MPVFFLTSNSTLTTAFLPFKKRFENVCILFIYLFIIIFIILFYISLYHYLHIIILPTVLCQQLWSLLENVFLPIQVGLLITKSFFSLFWWRAWFISQPTGAWKESWWYFGCLPKYLTTIYCRFKLQQFVHFIHSRKKWELRNPVPAFFWAKLGKILKILKR